MARSETTEITDPNDVERILDDRRFRVLQADRSGSRPVERFRAGVSRFVEGPEHAARRRRLVELLDGVDPNTLAASAALLTRRELDDAAPCSSARIARAARRVPVMCLAERLGFSDPSSLPALVAVVAGLYPTGSPPTDPAVDASSDRTDADAAVERLLDAAGTTGDAVLRVQLLVQAFAATAELIESAMRRSMTEDGAVRSTAELIGFVLREEPPVPFTRRVTPDATILTLHLRSGGDAARPLAFGAGTRACPAPRHALAIAAAVIDELRPC